MNLNPNSNQNNEIFPTEDALFTSDNQTISYGLEDTNSTNPENTGANLVLEENVSLETLDASATEDNPQALVFIDSTVPDSQILKY